MKPSIFIITCFVCLLITAGRADNSAISQSVALVKFTNQIEMVPGASGNPLSRSEIEAGLQALPTMSIIVNEAALFGPEGIYKNPFKTGRDWERAASVEYFDPKTHEVFRLNAGLRIHGDDSRGHLKKPFSLHFRREYGSGKLHFPLFPNSPVKKFDKLVLRSGGHDAWTSPLGYGLSQAISATYIRDEFLRSSHMAMGQPAVYGRFLHLFLNGKYWGLYNAVEAVDEHFMSSHLGGAKEDWDVVRGPDSGPFLVAGTNTAWNAMMALAEAGVTSTATFEQIQAYLDVDNLIDFMILRLWAGDMDWLRSRSEPTTGTRSKDWFAARNRKSGGKFIFFVWDEEISMGKDHEVNRRVNANLVDADVGNSPGRLYTRLRQNPEFRLRFADRLQKHFFGEGVLTRQKNLRRWQELVDLLESSMVAESARWGSASNPKAPFTRDNHWHSEVEWVKNTFFVQRNEIVLQQFQRIGLFPSNSAPTLNQNGGDVTAGFHLTLLNPNPSGAMYYTFNGKDPRDPGGAISPSARRYDSGITLSTNAQLKARVLRDQTWSAASEAAFTIFSSHPQPRLEE